MSASTAMAHQAIPKIESRLAALLLIVGAVVLYSVSDKEREREREYARSDAEGYYMYLPALTLYGFDSLPVRSTEQFQRISSTGRFYDKYTAGVALMQAPFYGLACLYSAIHPKYTVDGYSRPFQMSILLAAIFYTFLGLYILYKYLRRRFSVIVTAGVLLCIFLGTNLLYYTYREPGMSHAYCFFLWALLPALMTGIYEKPSWRNFTILSLIISLLVFVRPSNAIGVVAIVLWDMSSFRERIRFVTQNILKYVCLIAPFIVFTITQLFLWRHMSGEFIYFSYNTEPGFIYFDSPKIGNVLFHVHNGLFIYAPILLLSALGLIFGIENKQRNYILIFTTIFLFTYLFASWWAWWFGGAYGHRCFVDLLPLFAIPMAYLFSLVAESRLVSLKALFVTICIVFVYYSIGMTLAYRSPWDGPNFGWPEFWVIVNGIF